MTAQRRAFALWLGLGGGAFVVLTHLVTGSWPDAEMAISTAPTGLDLIVSNWLLIIGSAIIAATSAYVAIASIGQYADHRVRFAVVCGVVAPLVALANIYLAYHNGPDWLYESVTTGEGGVVIHRRTRNPWTVHLLLTAPLAGVVIGLALSRMLGVRTPGRVLVMIGAWVVAGIVAAYVAMPVLYMLSGALTDLSDGLGIGGRPGSIIGSFLAGYVVGYVFGIVGGFSIPGPQRPADSSRVPLP